MGQNDSNLGLVVLAIAIILGAMFMSGNLQLGNLGFQPAGGNNPANSGFQGEWGINPQQPDQQQPSQPPPSNPYITLTITPSTIQRGGTSTLTVASNFPNTQLEILFNYDGATPWTSLGFIPTDSNGGYTQTSTIGYAGFWNIKAKSGNIESNVASLTVYGITIYQSKSEWYVGETYSGALTGTYRNWWVHVFVKLATDTTWNYYNSALTDEHGVIPYGSLEEVIDSSQSGTTHNVIAVLDPEDASGEAYWMVIEDYGGTGIPLSQFDGRVESNILTFHVN